jgi:hypothetical protein
MELAFALCARCLHPFIDERHESIDELRPEPR